ncbi:hypothetical protein IFM89_010216 [Coptis chinensis]|uniref:beta-galactosidase n=1 Tax=Coptis chinensis TaxID=261450 RepID=A0A835LDH6_9MAGN|nr:hypothetical protein IFM89_010216 [Coptis chinensis]
MVRGESSRSTSQTKIEQLQVEMQNLFSSKEMKVVDIKCKNSDSITDGKNMLLGKLYGERKMNVQDIIDELHRGFYKLQFDNTTEYDHVRKNGPWFVHGFIISIKKWKIPTKLEEDSSFDLVKLWVQIFGLLENKINEENIKFIGLSLGKIPIRNKGAPGNQNWGGTGIMATPPIAKHVARQYLGTVGSDQEVAHSILFPQTDTTVGSGNLSMSDRIVESQICVGLRNSSTCVMRSMGLGLTSESNSSGETIRPAITDSCSGSLVLWESRLGSIDMDLDLTGGGGSSVKEQGLVCLDETQLEYTLLNPSSTVNSSGNVLEEFSSDSSVSDALDIVMLVLPITVVNPSEQVLVMFMAHTHQELVGYEADIEGLGEQPEPLALDSSSVVRRLQFQVKSYVVLIRLGSQNGEFRQESGEILGCKITRNETRFKHRMPNRERTIKRSTLEAEKCQKAFSTGNPETLNFVPQLSLYEHSDFDLIVHVIPNYCITIRFDASFQSTLGWAAARCIAWDNVGKVVGAATRRFKGRSAKETEMVAAKVVILLAISSGSTPGMWPDLIQKSKEGGLDAIETYVFWNAHEPHRHEYNFTRNLDLVRFLKIVQDVGLYVVLCIGPYVCAEWNYGGFPVWLHNMLGVELRTDNDAYKSKMQNFTTYIVDLMKKDKLLASQGDPIILFQIENEYDNIMSAYGDVGKTHINWCTSFAESLDIGVPWIMCQQSDAPQPMINTCNGFYCDYFQPNSPNSPKMWNENWTGWFKKWGGKDPHRIAKDVAYIVARFFQRGGTFQNYSMYHGGTNFGRTTSGLYIARSYDYDTPLDEYGNLNQPK